MREEFHCVRDPSAFGFGEVTAVVSVMIESWSDIETSTSMLSPRSSFTRSVMDGYLASWGPQWCSVVVKVSMNHCIGRQFGLYSGGSEEVETDVSLGDEDVQAVEREVRVCPTEHCAEVVLVSLDGSFCWVGPVVSW